MDLIKLHGAENNYFHKRIVRIVALCLAFLLAVIFSVAFALDFQPEHALFENGSVPAQIAYYGSFALAAAVFILAFVLIPKEKAEQGTFPKENEYVNYYTLDNTFIKIYRICLAALICVQGAVRSVFDGINGGGYLKVIVMLLLSVAMALYFVPELTEMIGVFGGRLHLAFGIFGMIWMLASTFTTYFDRTLPLASEYIVLAQIGYILALIALTYELRYRFDGTHIRARLASASAAFVFGFGFGVGRIVMLMTVGQVSYGDTASAITMLAISAYFGIRVFFYSED